MPEPVAADHEPSPLPEDLDVEAHVIATYRWTTPADIDIERAVAGIAELQSVGSGLSATAAASATVRRHLARVVGLWAARSVGSRRRPATRDWVFRIAYPAHNVGGQIPLLLTTVFGECASIRDLRLLDIRLPRAFLEAFPGPRFGIAGIRKIVGAMDRPLLVAMIKPSLGLTPSESADVFYQAAMGGADAVKDDELAVSHPWSSFAQRAREHAKAAERAFDDSGRRTLYFVNITDRPDRLVANAHEAIDAGATGLMVAFVPVGMAALAALAEDPSIDVPILGHLALAGAMYGGTTSGLSPHLVLGKLPRIAGADVVVYPSPYGPLDLSRSEHLQVAGALTESMDSIPPSLPTPGGGCHAGIVARLIEDLGTEMAIGAGGAIHTHPMGIAAGARAIQQAIDAALAGEPVESASARQPELAAALARLPGRPPFFA
jgi:ribulose 1,5-bisphosphate carboxylase large subunit-like protein